MRARLRSATAALHAQLDALFPRGLDSIATYRRYLLGMHRFVVDYEIVVDALPRRSAWLASDLGRLSLLPLVARGRCRKEPHAAARLGWDYVLAGSSLGARSLVRDARRLGFSEHEGARFLAGHARSPDWSELQLRLQALDPDDRTRVAQAEAGAIAAFALVRDCFARSLERIPAQHEDSP